MEERRKFFSNATNFSSKAHIRIYDFLQLGKLRPGEVLDAKVRFVFAITQSLPTKYHHLQHFTILSFYSCTVSYSYCFTPCPILFEPCPILYVFYFLFFAIFIPPIELLSKIVDHFVWRSNCVTYFLSFGHARSFLWNPAIKEIRAPFENR